MSRSTPDVRISTVFTQGFLKSKLSENALDWISESTDSPNAIYTLKRTFLIHLLLGLIPLRQTKQTPSKQDILIQLLQMSGRRSAMMYWLRDASLV